MPEFTLPVAGYLTVAATIAALIRMLRGHFLLFSLLCLPGTLSHELLHWIVAFLFNAHPGKLSIIPKRNGDSYILGTVECRNVRWYNGWIVGTAPLLLLPCAYWLATQHASDLSLHPTPLDAALIYLTAQFLIACIPSVQDIKIALYNSWWLLAIGMIYLFGNPT